MVSVLKLGGSGGMSPRKILESSHKNMKSVEIFNKYAVINMSVFTSFWNYEEISASRNNGALLISSK